MKGDRRRVLSTFQILTFDPDSSLPRPAALPPLEQPPQVTSAVRRRHALDVGLSPRLSRQASDLALFHNRRRGWGVGVTGQLFDPSRNKGQRPRATRKNTRVFIGPGCDQQQLLSPSHSARPITYAQHDAAFTSLQFKFPEVTPTQRTPILRRPTASSVTPVVENGPLFHLLVMGKELKPLNWSNDGDDDHACSQFYSNHFPLLLRKFSNTSLPGAPTNKAMTEREAEEQIRLSEKRCRAREIRERMKRADDMLHHFETDPEDCGPIQTELRAELFNPAAWSWNLERYSLDGR